MKNPDFNQFYQYGFWEVHDPELGKIFENFPLSKVTWTDDHKQPFSNFLNENPLSKTLLTHAQMLIATKYLGSEFSSYELRHKKIWSSFTEDQLSYHNDMYKQTEDDEDISQVSRADYNVLAFLYLTDMKKIKHGGVWFTDGISETYILPEFGTLVLVNCSHPRFKHKGEFTSHERHMAQFGYYIPTLSSL